MPYCHNLNRNHKKPRRGEIIMTLGEARGKRVNMVLEPRRRRYQLRPRNPTGQAPSGLTNLFSFTTPGCTGGHNCQDPAILRDRSLHIWYQNNNCIKNQRSFS